METVTCGRWRVGSKVKRNLYCGDEPVAMLANEAMAERIAEGMNAAENAEMAVQLLKAIYKCECGRGMGNAAWAHSRECVDTRQFLAALREGKAE